MRSLQVESPAVNGRLLLLFHDAVFVAREQHALQPLALAVASLHVFVSLPTRACVRHNSFCIVFSNKFNIMSTFLSTNRSLGCRKSILAKVCFDAKRG